MGSVPDMLVVWTSKDGLPENWVPQAQWVAASAQNEWARCEADESRNPRHRHGTPVGGDSRRELTVFGRLLVPVRHRHLLDVHGGRQHGQTDRGASARLAAFRTDINYRRTGANARRHHSGRHDEATWRTTPG